MTALDDLITLDEAARISNRKEVTLRGAARRGTLDARKFGTTYVTTADAVSRYLAYIASQGWAQRSAIVRRRAEALRRHKRVKRRPAA